MAGSKRIIRFAEIARFFSEETNLIDRGENAVQSGHIKSFRYLAEVGILEGEVYASMKDRAYAVKVSLF